MSTKQQTEWIADDIIYGGYRKDVLEQTMKRGQGKNIPHPELQLNRLFSEVLFSQAFVSRTLAQILTLQGKVDQTESNHPRDHGEMTDPKAIDRKATLLQRPAFTGKKEGE